MPRSRAPQGLSAVETCPPSTRPGTKTACDPRRTPSRRTGERQLKTRHACEPEPVNGDSWRSVPPWRAAGQIPLSFQAAWVEARRAPPPAGGFGPACAIPKCASRDRVPGLPNGAGFGPAPIPFPKFGARLQRFLAGGRCAVMQSGPGTVPGGGLPFREPEGSSAEANPVGPAAAEIRATACSADPAR